MPKEPISCKKWTGGGDGAFQCTQTGGSPCGCQSSIIHPSNIDCVLNDGQKKERDQAIKDIRNSIRGDQAALVLGAGIGQPSRMPSWSGLISQMMGYAIQYDQLTQEDSSAIKTASREEQARLLKLSRSLMDGELSLLGNVNTLESAEYVAQLFDTVSTGLDLRRRLESRAIASMVRQIVDKSRTPRDLLLAPQTGLRERVAEFERRSPHRALLFETVAEIGTEEIARKNAMFAVSYLLSSKTGIRRAMTYNYDPLVQEHMMDLYGVGSGELITHPGLWGTKDAKPDVREIYHVHGFVPGQRHLSRGDERVFPKNSGPIILSEDSYYQVEQQEAYNWSSSIQSYFLNRYQCIFVGFSADDYNFRRILRQIGEARLTGPHYLILSVRKWISNTYEEVCRARLKRGTTAGKIHEADKKEISEDAILLLQYILECRALYWKRFNILPVWVMVEEIPQLLTDLLS